MIGWIVSSSVLIVVTIGLRFLLKNKLAPALQYGLWLLVLLRLLIPGELIPSPISVQNLLAVPEQVSQTQSNAIAYEEHTVQQEITASPHIVPENTQPRIEIPTKQQPAAVKATISLKAAFKGIWVVGTIVVLLVFLFTNLHFYLKLRRSRKPLAVICKIPVYTSEGLSSPCLFGLLRVSIYIPCECAKDETLLSHILAHEMSHYRHGDHLWSLLRGIAVAFHWYNPLVWIAAIFSKQDAELSCDASAIKKLGEQQRISYGQTLLQLIVSKPKPADLLSCATTMTSGKRSLRYRIQCIAKQPKTLAITLACVLLVLTVTVGCTFTGVKEQSDDELLQLTEVVEEVAANETEEITGHTPAEEAAYEHPLVRRFPLLNETTIPSITDQDWSSFYLNEAGLDDNGTEIYTTLGDQVLAVDAKNGILLIRVVGEDYQGVLAWIDDPTKLSLQVSSQLGNTGETIGEIAEAHNGILAVNASRSVAVVGNEEGASIADFAVCNGVAYNEDLLIRDDQARLEINSLGEFSVANPAGSLGEDVKHAVQFTPALIIDGVIVAEGLENWSGLHPRSCIGQTAAGNVLILVVEGRLPERSTGAALAECASILLRYDAEQAMTLDYGSSSILWYDGEYVTMCSNRFLLEGRRLPNAFVVERTN